MYTIVNELLVEVPTLSEDLMFNNVYKRADTRVTRHSP